MVGINKSNPPNPPVPAAPLQAPIEKASTPLGEVERLNPESQLRLQSDQVEGKGIRERSASLQSNDSGIVIDSVSEASAANDRLSFLLGKAEEVMGLEFDSRYYLSGHGEDQKKQISQLTAVLLEELEGESSPEALSGRLEELLKIIKNCEQDKPWAEQLRPYNFALRTAILLASEQTGAGILSWDAYTKQTPDGKKLEAEHFWPWVENYKNWIPEGQAVYLKYIETAFIKARNLGQKHPEDQVVAYKGGFGAGKTSHGRAAFGLGEGEQPLFSGSIAPDSAKNAVRRGVPVSHNTAHLQGSNMAYSLFNGLIKQQGVGTVIYDTSLSRPSDVYDLIQKADQANKPLKIVDVTRDDRARLLAVLARNIEGEDPRIPVSYLLDGAQRDREARSDCMNIFLMKSLPEQTDSSESEVRKAHTYEFHCGDDYGSDSKRLFTLKQGEWPEWNPELDHHNIDVRLLSQGLRFNDETGRFEATSKNEGWSVSLIRELQNPVRDLVSGLSDKEKEVRTKTFSARKLVLAKPMAEATLDEAYRSLSPELSDNLSKAAFNKSWVLLTPKVERDLLSRMKEASEKGEVLSYMDLPAVMALQMNSQLRETPVSWAV